MDALRHNILEFCKAFGFTPSPQQELQLLKVQNNTCRLGMHLPLEEVFPIIATSMLWRALCFDVPSICLTEFKEHGNVWVKLLQDWADKSDPNIQSKLRVAESGSFMQTSDGVTICDVVGPFNMLEDYHRGKQDILLLDFDVIPSSRMNQALNLADGALMYLPTYPDEK